MVSWRSGYKLGMANAAAARALALFCGPSTRGATMFKHILVPVDGSPTAAVAIDKAIALAKAFQSAVTAIYVIDPYPFTGVGTDYAYGQEQYLAAATGDANEAVDRKSTRLNSSHHSI